MGGGCRRRVFEKGRRNEVDGYWENKKNKENAYINFNLVKVKFIIFFLLYLFLNQSANILQFL